MARPEILFISQRTSRIMFELAERVSREVGDTLVLTGRDCPFEPKGRLEIWWGPSYDNSTYASRLATWLQFSTWVLAQSPRIHGTPLNIVTSNPPILPLVAALLKSTRGWPFVARILDIYPQFLVRQGLMTNAHPVVRAWGAANRWAYRRADAMITLAPQMGKTLSEHLPPTMTPMLIPDWVDPGWVRPLERSENWFVKKHGLEDKFVVLYSGNLGVSHDISGLVHAAEALRDDSNIVFLFIGGGARAGELEALADRLGNCIKLPYQPDEAVPYAMAAAHLGVVALGETSRGVSMPSKSYFLMAAGCALLGLTSGEDDVRILIDQYQCGVHALASDGPRIRNEILRLRNDATELQKLRHNARAAAEETFSAKAGMRKYLDLIERLRSGRTHERTAARDAASSANGSAGRRPTRVVLGR